MTYQCFAEGCPANHVSKHEVCTVSSNERLTPEKLAEYRDLLPMGRFVGVGGDALKLLLDEIEACWAERKPVETKAPLPRIRLKDDIYDDGADHHPPGIIAYKGDVLEVRELLSVGAAHPGASPGKAFIVRPGEFEEIRPEEPRETTGDDPGKCCPSCEQLVCRCAEEQRSSVSNAAPCACGDRDCPGEEYFNSPVEPEELRCAICTKTWDEHKTIISHKFKHRPAHGTEEPSVEAIAEAMAEDPAYPDADTGQQGLTKREEFAKAAMQGFLSGAGCYAGTESVAAYAVRQADALLKELAK